MGGLATGSPITFPEEQEDPRVSADSNTGGGIWGFFKVIQLEPHVTWHNFKAHFIYEIRGREWERTLCYCSLNRPSSHIQTRTHSPIQSSYICKKLMSAGIVIGPALITPNLSSKDVIYHLFTIVCSWYSRLHNYFNSQACSCVGLCVLRE